MAYNNGVYEATDQQSIGFMNSEAARIEARVREEKLAKVKYPELIYVDTSAMGVGDDSLVTYIGRPGTGRMTPLAVGATDFPRVEVEYDRITLEAYSSGISYGWDDQEVERAQVTRRNLTGDRIRAAFNVAEQEKEKAVLMGNTTYGWYGLVTNQPTQTNGASVGNRFNSETGASWVTGGASQAYSDIRKAFTKVYADTKQIFMPDTMLVSVNAGSFLFEPMAGTDGNNIVGMSIMSYLRNNNPYTYETGNQMNIVMVNEMPSGQALIYDSSEEAGRFVVAQDLTFTGPQRHAFNNVWYGRMKLGGNQFFHPQAYCILSGIGL